MTMRKHKQIKNKALLDAMIDGYTARPQRFEKEAEKAMEILRDAKVDALINHPFFSTILLQLETVFARIPTVATDGKNLYINPFFITAQKSFDDIEFLLCHEIMHIILLHLDNRRRGNRDPQLYNLAGDYVINNTLLESGLKASEALRQTGAFDARFKGMTTEQVYDILVKEMPASPPRPQCGNSGQQSQQSGGGSNSPQQKPEQGGESGGQGHDHNHDHSHGHGDGNTLKDIIDKYKNKKGEMTEDDFWDMMEELGEKLKKSGTMVVDDNCYHGKDLTDAEEQQLKDLIATAEQVARQQGKMPAGLERYVEQLLYPKVPWTAVLAEFVEEVFAGDYNWDVPDRLYLQEDMVVPSPYELSTGEIAIAIDTSGSVSEKELTRAASELNEILDKIMPSRTLVIYCDADIHHVDEFFPGDQLRFKPLGGGGTSFVPVFKYIEKNDIHPKCLLFFTDTFGDFPKSEPPYPVLWAVFETANRWGNVKVPFGRILEVPVNG